MGKKGAAAAAAEAPAANSAENIKVLVRCRPLNSKELEAGYKSCVDLNLAEATVSVNHVCGAPDRWTFDAVVNNTFSQKDVFTQFIMPLVDSVLDGFNATVFAYGQSGSGKTHTMTGKYDDPELMGIIPRSFRYIFEYIRNAQATNPNRKYDLYCSFIELYNGKVRDLLAKQQVTLNVKENKDKTFYVQGAYVPQVKFPEDLIRLMEEGTDRRQVASTELNADSSRSHSIFTLMVESIETDDSGDTRSVTSKFNLVDLAGSERQSKTGAQGDTLKEGCNINLSLSALGTVIDTLVKGKGHVPFRSSPLTMLLKDSLGGSSKTVMFANIGPSEHNLSETVSTLRFADRAKQIKNKPVVNMDSKDQKIAELTELVAQLKEKLKALETGDMERLEQELEELKEHTGQLEVDLDNAVKGRDADRVEATQARDALKAELDAAVAEKQDALLRCESLQQELRLAEQAAADEKRQRDEVWTACSQQLGVEIPDIDTLLKKLKTFEGSVPHEEHQRLQAECRRLTAEMDAARETHEADVAATKASEQAAREELEQVTRKIEKMKEKLEKEKETRRHLMESHEAAGSTSGGPSPSKSGAATGDPAETQPSAMQSTVSFHGAPAADEGAWLSQKQELEAHYRTHIKSLESRIEKLVSEGPPPAAGGADHAAMLQERDASIAKLLSQLDELSSAQTAANDDDTVVISNLKLVISGKDEALAHANREISRLEAQLKWYAENGAAGNTTEIVKSVHDLHAEQRAALRHELHHTRNHRDKLLALVLDGAGANGDQNSFSDRERSLADQIVSLMDEVKMLQAKSAADATEVEGAITKDDDARRMQAQINHLESQLESTKQSMRDAWSEEITVLNAKIADLESNFASREKELIAIATEGTADERSAQRLEQLQTEKSLLIAERNKAQNELHLALAELSSKDDSGNGSNGREGAPAALAPNGEVQNLLVASEEDSAEVAAFKQRLRAALHVDATALENSEPALKRALSHRKNSILGGGNNDANDSSVQNSRMTVLEEEKAELAAELEALKAESDQRLDAAKKDSSSLREEISQRSKELAAAKLQIAEEQNRVAELQDQLNKAAKDSESFTQTQQALESRLKEKVDQNAELRKLLDGQKHLLDATKAKVESLQQSLANAKEELVEREKIHQTALRDQEAASQRALNRRVEALVEEHHKALAKKDEDIQSIKKKMRKLEKELTRAQEMYDEKMCEYEELVGRMEEQKFDAMRNLKGDEQVELEEAQVAVGDALKRAKEDQRRKLDKFATGETTSAVSGIRAVAQGSAAAMARSQRKSGSGGSGVTPTEADLVPRRPSPPRQPTYAAVGGERNMGGAGFNSAINYGARPSTTQGGGRPMTGQAGAVPHTAHAQGGGDGGDDDMYNF